MDKLLSVFTTRLTMKKVLVFGIFDGVHPGHIDFFRQAKKHGDILVVAVGRPSASKKFKDKLPKHSLAERIKFVQDAEHVDKAVPGDREQGSYEIILREKPDIICLGYDQRELGKNLRHWTKKSNPAIAIQTLKPYVPKKYHTSTIDNT